MRKSTEIILKRKARAAFRALLAALSLAGLAAVTIIFLILITGMGFGSVVFWR